MKIQILVLLLSTAFLLHCDVIECEENVEDDWELSSKFVQLDEDQSLRDVQKLPALTRTPKILKDIILPHLRSSDDLSSKDVVTGKDTLMMDGRLTKRYMLRYTARYCMPNETCLRSRGRHRWFGCVCPGRTVCRLNVWRGSRCW